MRVGPKFTTSSTPSSSRPRSCSPASSVVNPRTNFGKVLELFFDIWAITVVATVAGSFGAFFHARSKEMDGEMERIERRLEGEVEALRERLR